MKVFSHSQIGMMYAFGAYLIWGFAPLYFKHLGFVPVYEMLSHRVIWSVLFIALVLTFTGAWLRVWSLLKSPKSIAVLMVSTLLISTNWGVFIWAINNDRMLDASLGYFINPLINVLLGVIFLNESLTRIKWIAISLAFLGVIVQVIELGSLPWVSLILPISFALYGLARKMIKVEALTGLFIETLLLLPFALFYLCYFAHSDSANVFNNNMVLNGWLMLAGVVTATPLIFFTKAALRLTLSTLGFFQYIGPSLLFIFAVIVYGEPLALVKVITFLFIWSGVLLFAFENKITAFLK